MRIKRIEIIGFKSFCDRTVLNFTDPITGVVGPNGCGKSNIVDAIRWCMGEQSAKHLRGKAMDDVIFAGSDSRGPASMAEVSLTFEDVGFSEETLRLALHDQDDASTAGLSPEEAAVTAESGTEDVEPSAGPEAVEAGEPAEAEGADAAADATVQVQADDSAAEASAPASAEPAEPAPPSASEEVAEMLADKPPAIDFAQYSEVTISRRLFRDGTSNYYLNKTPCRLRDITDFFLGTGVGTKAYSIIEQGRVGMIVSSRPQDRRHIIDEAAGITKFKTKKKAAERKLEQTRQNLLRVSDIVTELAKRLGTLRRQAQKAERYRRYKAEVKDIELTMATQKYLEYGVEEKMLAGNLASVRAELEKARAEYDARDANVVAERAELSIEERRLSQLQEEVWELENRLKLSENKIEYQRREAGELDERAKSATTEIAGLKERRQQGAEELERVQAELGGLSDEVEAARQTAVEREQAAREARELLAEAQRGLEAARGKLAEARADLARAVSQKDSLGRRREDAEARLARVTEETEVGNARARELDKQIRGLSDKLSGLKQTRLDLGARKEDFERQLGELEDTASRCEAEVETLRTELHRRRSRLQSLKEIHDKYEGFARGTRTVMQASAEVLGAEGREHIRGLVADYVDAPANLEIAVEAALGDRLGGILVDSHEVGAKAIEYLKTKSAGRSAFVPFADPGTIDASGGIAYEDRSSGVASDTAREGVLGSMVDLVRFESGFDKVARNLLGECLVVESLGRAIELHQSGARETLVTLDGDVVDSRGVVFGGSRDAQGAGVLAQKREIRELEEIVAGLETDLTDATVRLTTSKQQLVLVSKALKALQTETHDGEIAIMGHEKDLGGARAELERLRERLTRLNSEQLELEERLAAMTAESAAMEELEVSATERISIHEKEQLGLIESVTEGQVKAEELSQLLTEAKILVAQLGEKRASLEASVLRLSSADQELGERLARLEGSIRDDSERAEILRQECDDIEEELVEVREARMTKSEALTDGRNSYEMRMADMQVAEMTVRELRTRSEKLSGETSGLEIRLANIEQNRLHLEEGIADRYGLALSRNLGDYHMRPMIGAEDEKRLAELRGIINRMGSDINLTAIEEFEEISERHDFLSTQQKDLENAVEQLEKAIAKINRTSRRLFRETYDAINKMFQEVYPRLFRGGRARLTLTGGEDVDLLEAGVEIMAQPPGKKNSTVDQLSGGEKALTAVALIFAIFLVKPSPFCLLDEVDAPLDDVNVDRYNEIVREMTDRSQFIVITHNKRTMEITDQLYGVTMQEPGVSKIVSVNLNKIDEAIAA